jgi:cobalt-zinc-cadmium efflux system outer membrane protein
MKRLILLSLCLPAAIRAAEPGPPAAEAAPSITVQQLVAGALETNPELNFYRAEILAAKAGRKSAGLLANPEVSGSLGYKTSRERSSALSGEGVAWSVSVVQPLEWPGRIGLRKAIANRDVELADLGLERFRTALSGRVRGLAYGLFAAQQKAAAAREVADRFRALREVLLQRDPAGVAPLLETRVIEATEITMQHQASEAELAAQFARFELNQLRGAAPASPLSVTEPAFGFGPAASNQILVALALTNNFELRARAVELAQQGYRVALARNERFPAISVGPSYSEETALDRERIVGVGVSLPLPLWNRNSANIEAAAARRLQAETSYVVAQRDVERKVIEAAGSYAAKVREMAGWRPDAVRHFQEAAELADRHYRLGAVPISTYIELQKQYFEAVESLLNTRKEALEAAQQLESLTGLALELTREPVQEAK